MVDQAREQRAPRAAGLGRRTSGGGRTAGAAQAGGIALRFAGHSRLLPA
jgi:hypothetical protein